MGSPKSVTLGPSVLVSDPNSLYKTQFDCLSVQNKGHSLDISHLLPPYPSFTFFSFTFCYTMPLHFFQIIPNINTLDDFGAQDPSAISGLTSPTKPVTEGVVSSPFSLSVLVLIVVSYYIIYIF